LAGGNKEESRAMLINPFRRSLSDGPFRTRALSRDQDLDDQLVGQVATAIDKAVQEVEAQRDGLKRRLDDVIARAAIVGGNDLDDLLTRDEARATLLAASDSEIARGQERLKTLDEQLSHFRFLKDALQSRFPDFNPGAGTAAG
jgi:hypothetical protein